MGQSGQARLGEGRVDLGVDLVGSGEVEEEERGRRPGSVRCKAGEN